MPARVAGGAATNRRRRRAGRVPRGSYAVAAAPSLPGPPRAWFKTPVVERAAPWTFVFLMAYIGAAIYFVSASDGSFWGVVLGLLQAIVWPVYVVYHVLVLIGA